MTLPSSWSWCSAPELTPSPCLLGRPPAGHWLSLGFSLDLCLWFPWSTSQDVSHPGSPRPAEKNMCPVYTYQNSLQILIQVERFIKTPQSKPWLRLKPTRPVCLCGVVSPLVPAAGTLADWRRLLQGCGALKKQAVFNSGLDRLFIVILWHSF